jgi:hypothetical protein
MLPAPLLPSAVVKEVTLDVKRMEQQDNVAEKTTNKTVVRQSERRIKWSKKGKNRRLRQGHGPCIH